MQYEVAHDRLANIIFDKTSVESKARRKVEKLVERAFERFQNKGILLTQDDIDEIKPHKENIDFPHEIRAFIEKSHLTLQAAARRRRNIAISITLTILAFAIVAAIQWYNAAQQQIPLLG